MTGKVVGDRTNIIVDSKGSVLSVLCPIYFQVLYIKTSIFKYLNIVTYFKLYLILYLMS